MAFLQPGEVNELHELLHNNGLSAIVDKLNALNNDLLLEDLQNVSDADLTELCVELNLTATQKIKFKKVIRGISQNNNSLVNGNYIVNPPKSYLKTVKYDYNIKMILVGDSGAGKTAIISRITHNVFNPDTVTTIGVDYSIISMITSANKNVKVTLWDTGGQERFSVIPRQYYNNMDCAIIVFDMTNKNSFKQAISFWLQEIRDYGSRKIVYGLLVGNKSDCNNIQVDSDEAYQTALKHKLGYCQVSAKNGSNMKSMIVTAVTQTILFKQKYQMKTICQENNRMRQESVSLRKKLEEMENQVNKKNSSGCCFR